MSPTPRRPRLSIYLLPAHAADRPLPGWLRWLLRQLPDLALTRIHRALHLEWQRRCPDGLLPAAELRERRRELAWEERRGRPVSLERRRLDELMEAILLGHRTEARRLADRACASLSVVRVTEHGPGPQPPPVA